MGGVGIGDVEHPVWFELRHEPGPVVEQAVVSSAEQDEVVHAGLAAVAEPVHMMTFTPRWRPVAAREAAVPVADDHR